MTSSARSRQPAAGVVVALAVVAALVLGVALWPGDPAPSRAARAAAGDGADAPAAAARPDRAPTPPAPMLLDAQVDAEVDAESDSEPPIAAVRLDELQTSVRRFYEGLPEGWRMPEKIRIDEVLSADAIDVLGVPPESILDELSHYPLSMRTGLEIVLEMGPDADSVGIAVILPSGRRYTDVLAIVPPPTP